MKIIKPLDARKKLVHKHIVYQWPPRANEATARCSCQHLVFPAVVANTSNLQAVLDRHLGILVDEYFDQFPAYESIFRILRPIQAFYQRLPEGETQQLLRQALKLLTLVHVGGDVQVCDGDATASLLIVKIFGPATGIGTRPYFATCPSNIGALPTPCFIRGQFGEVMPLLAQDLMKDVLVRLELLSLARECNQWANACATFAVFVMAVESIQYHTKKIAFHADGGPAIEEMSRVFGPPAPPELVGQKTQQTQPLSSMEQALQALVGFYKSCFSGCHSRLSDEPGGRQRSSSGGGSALRSGQRDAQESLVTELKKVLAGAQTYLLEKSKASCKTGEDLSCFFDRSLAKLFLLI